MHILHSSIQEIQYIQGTLYTLAMFQLYCHALVV